MVSAANLVQEGNSGQNVYEHSLLVHRTELLLTVLSNEYKRAKSSVVMVYPLCQAKISSKSDFQ